MNETRKLMSNTIRFLAADMVQAANSGHPGAPMGMADLMTVLSDKITHNPKNPKWLNRDRLVFSGGHASSLVYSMLYLWGYDVNLDDLKNFRKLGSHTPGHPEYGHTAGIEVTTGPLGQGFANAVGFAAASKYAANLLNGETAKIINHKVWCLCGDGDLQEGISYEAASLAGHMELGNLVVLFDSNAITIEGDTSVSTSEDIAKRFEAQKWRVLEVDGHNFDALDSILDKAKASDGRPTLVIVTTKMAKGAATLEGSHHAHGAPLGAEEIKKSKEIVSFPEESFTIPEAALVRFRCAIEKGDLAEREWNHLVKSSPDLEKNALLNQLSKPDFSGIIWPEFEKATATRDSNGKILNALAKSWSGFIGGSADLAPSNKTELVGFGDFPNGRNIHFGIREHAMAAMTNAIALYGLFKPFCSTFFVFSDYLRPAVRVAALSKIQTFFVFTHDSIGVGEDGPTHQPVEHLASFRVMPDVLTFRPADAYENIECWKAALEFQGPSLFVLSRQNLPLLPKAVY
ncbi:MAG: hypothetical protein RL154_541, partial [Pseudomonadota bacterium]